MQDFRNCVLEGKFEQAYNLSKDMKKEEVRDDLIAISFNTSNMLAYGFINYMLLMEETDDYHCMAISVLMNSYIDIEGVAELAYCHAKRMVERDSTSFDGLAEMMLQSSHPDNSGTKSDYEWAKKRIAELYPDDPILKVPYGSGMTPEQAQKSRLSEWNK